MTNAERIFALHLRRPARIEWAQHLVPKTAWEHAQHQGSKDRHERYQAYIDFVENEEQAMAIIDQITDEMANAYGEDIAESQEMQEIIVLYVYAKYDVHNEVNRKVELPFV